MYERSIDRRHDCSVRLAATLSLLLVSGLGSCAARATEIEAVSLRVLQADLQACAAHGNCDPRLLGLDGMTSVVGYVIDTDAQDVILFGETQPGPSLHVEDLVVALRSAWHRYDRVEGRTRYFTPPGVSIEPRSEVRLALRRAGQSLQRAKDESGIDAAIDSWTEACRRMQDVLVLGVPRDSRAARVMFIADYEMKQIVDGSLDLGIEGFSSLPTLMIAQIEKRLQRGEPLEMGLGGMTRFWFYPGETTFEAAEGIMRINAAEVVLLDEAQRVTRSGQAVPSGRVDPLAREVANSFSRHFDAVAERREIYADLENLFRFVALAKIMKQRAVPAKARLAIDLLLDGLTISGKPVEPEVPGIANVGRAEYRGTRGAQQWIQTLRLPSCGGVAIDYRLENLDVTPRDSGDLLRLERAILTSRPTSDSRSWTVLGYRAP